MQESYNSLQQTGVQIKNRLLDSLEKFDEYETTLQSIMDNIKQWEPEIMEDLQKPIEDIISIETEMENIRVSTPITEYFSNIFMVIQCRCC